MGGLWRLLALSRTTAPQGSRKLTWYVSIAKDRNRISTAQDAKKNLGMIWEGERLLHRKRCKDAKFFLSPLLLVRPPSPKLPLSNRPWRHCRSLPIFPDCTLLVKGLLLRQSPHYCCAGRQGKVVLQARCVWWSGLLVERCRATLLLQFRLGLQNAVLAV